MTGRVLFSQYHFSLIVIATKVVSFVLVSNWMDGMYHSLIGWFTAAKLFEIQKLKFNQKLTTN